MDIGLYTLKYPARRMLAGVLPAFRNVSPNTLSALMLPVGVLIALAYYYGALGWSALYVAGAFLILVRMFLGTMDGLVATQFDKATLAGDILNRLAPELCDVMLMLSLALARPDWRVPAISALAACWLVTFAGLLGATVGCPTQSVGPAGQTDRLVLLQAISILSYLAARWGWSVDLMALFLWWVAIGGALTTVLRLRRHFRAVTVASSA